jgi:hypothetical protein
MPDVVHEHIYVLPCDASNDFFSRPSIVLGHCAMSSPMVSDQLERACFDGTLVSALVYGKFPIRSEMLMLITGKVLS